MREGLSRIGWTQGRSLQPQLQVTIFRTGWRGAQMLPQVELCPPDTHVHAQPPEPVTSLERDIISEDVINSEEVTWERSGHCLFKRDTWTQTHSRSPRCKRKERGYTQRRIQASESPQPVCQPSVSPVGRPLVATAHAGQEFSKRVESQDHTVSPIKEANHLRHLLTVDGPLTSAHTPCTSLTAKRRSISTTG